MDTARKIAVMKDLLSTFKDSVEIDNLTAVWTMVDRMHAMGYEIGLCWHAEASHYSCWWDEELEEGEEDNMWQGSTLSEAVYHAVAGELQRLKELPSPGVEPGLATIAL